MAVVSDFDLLALDEISGKREATFFPSVDESWGAFKARDRRGGPAASLLLLLLLPLLNPSLCPLSCC